MKALKRPLRPKPVKKSKWKPQRTSPASRAQERLQQQFLQSVPYVFVPPKDMPNPLEKTGLLIKQRFIERWIIRGWVISPGIAWRKFGHMRLADVVYRMREAGFVIHTTIVKGKDRFGNVTHYAEYKINKKRSAKAIKMYEKKYGKAA